MKKNILCGPPELKSIRDESFGVFIHRCLQEGGKEIAMVCFC